jgi:hypothetical protein
LDFAQAAGITGGESIFERKAGSLSCGRLCLFVGKLARKDREIASLEEPGQLEI